MAPNGNIRWPHTALLAGSPNGPERQYRWPPQAQILNPRNPEWFSTRAERQVWSAVSFVPVEQLRAPSAALFLASVNSFYWSH
jgi:hypothetical protein